MSQDKSSHTFLTSKSRYKSSQQVTMTEVHIFVKITIVCVCVCLSETERASERDGGGQDGGPGHKRHAGAGQ